MIFPAGKPRNSAGNPLTEVDASHDPRSSQYKPEFKKDVRAASKANREAFAQLAKELAETRAADPAAHAAVRSAHSIGKANLGAVSDIGGGIKYLGASTQNSIWNPNRLAQIKDEELTQGERIKADNAKIAEDRKQLRKQQFTIDPEAVKAALRPSASIAGTPRPQEQAPNYKNRIAAHQMSIFDKGDKLDNIASPTREVEIRKAAEARRNKKDDSWQQVSGTTTSKQKLSSLFSNLKKTVEGEGK